METDWKAIAELYREAHHLADAGYPMNAAREKADALYDAAHRPETLGERCVRKWYGPTPEHYPSMSKDLAALIDREVATTLDGMSARDVDVTTFMAIRRAFGLDGRE